MVVDRCTETEPHPAHRTDYGPFGVKDCAGVPVPRPVPSTADRLADARTATQSDPRWQLILDAARAGARKGAEDQVGDAVCDAYSLGAAAGERRLLDANKAIIGENHNLREQIGSYQREVKALNGLLTTARAERDQARAERDNVRECEQLLTADLRQTRQHLVDAHVDRDQARAASNRYAALIAASENASRLAEAEAELGLARQTIAAQAAQLRANGTLICLLRDLDEQRDRAWAAYDTVSEPAVPDDASTLRQAARLLRRHADDHAKDPLGFGIGWAADALDAWAKTPDEGASTDRPVGVSLPSHWTKRCAEGCTGHPEGDPTDAR
jgi:hypothetical protein